MNIGLYFGSFNPIHIGHLIIANHVLNETAIEKLWLIVSPQNPFKDTPRVDATARLRLARTAVMEDGRILASGIELELPKPSYTADTLKKLTADKPGDSFSLIMGSDTFNQLPGWKEFHSILAYPILIYRRYGFEVGPTTNSRFQILDAPFVGISSTTIRELIDKGKSIRYLVPENVRVEILKEYQKK